MSVYRGVMPPADGCDLEHVFGVVAAMVHGKVVSAGAPADFTDRGALDLAAVHGLLSFPLGEGNFWVPLPVERYCLAIARSSPL